MNIYKTPAPNEASERAAAFFDSLVATHINLVSCLFNRWLDEKKYEDINDYRKPFEPILVEFDVTISKMNKSPFGFDFIADGRTYKFSVKSNGSISFNRIK